MTSLAIETSSLWLRAATILYAVGLAHALLFLTRRSSKLFAPALSLFRIAVVLHFVSLAEQALASRSLPLNNFFETSSACGLLIAVLFLLVLRRYKVQQLSVFVFPLAFLMTLAGSLAGPAAPWSSQTARGSWLLLHVALVILGFAALAVMTGASVLYLWQEQRLKRKPLPAWMDKLAPLGTLDELVSRSMIAAFVFVTLSVIAGSVWGFIEWGTGWTHQPKIAISLITWGAYLAMVYLRAVAGWRGRRAAWLALVVVAFSVATWAAHVGLQDVFLR